MRSFSLILCSIVLGACATTGPLPAHPFDGDTGIRSWAQGEDGLLRVQVIGEGGASIDGLMSLARAHASEVCAGGYQEIASRERFRVGSGEAAPILTSQDAEAQRVIPSGPTRTWVELDLRCDGA